jgi:hypothetical protein
MIFFKTHTNILIEIIIKIIRIKFTNCIYINYNIIHKRYKYKTSRFIIIVTFLCIYLFIKNNIMR